MKLIFEQPKEEILDYIKKTVTKSHPEFNVLLNHLEQVTVEVSFFKETSKVLVNSSITQLVAAEIINFRGILPLGFHITEELKKRVNIKTSRFSSQLSKNVFTINVVTHHTLADFARSDTDITRYPSKVTKIF